MKITIKALLIILAMFITPLAWGQDNVYYPQVYNNGGQITASVASTGACPPGSCIGITIPTTVTTITVGVLGTFSATLQPEESQNGGYTWTSAGTAITTPGTTVYTVTAFTNFRVRASAYVSGVANVNIQAGPTGGNGSATAGVTSLNGLVGAVTLAAGSGVTITPSGNTLTIASTGGGGSTPAGPLNAIQFNNPIGTFDGVAAFTFAPSTDSFTKTGLVTSFDSITAGPTNANGLQIDGSAGGSVVLFASESTSTLLLESDSGIIMESTTGGLVLGNSVGGASFPIQIFALTSGSTTLTVPATDTEELDIGKVGGGNAKLGLLGTTSGTFQISTNATASQLNFGSNANVTSAGALTVTSCTGCGSSSGTVTSVSFTGGLISVATPTTTPALTVAGTSGGIPYFSGAATWASSAAGTVNTLMKWGGAGNPPIASSVTDNGTTVSTGEQIVSTLATGTAPFSVASTTNVANLNASSLNGATFAAPGAIGGTTPGSGAFTTLTSSSTDTFSGAGAASTASVLLNGTLFSGGSGTTTFPYLLLQPSGTSAVTTWATAGTMLGINAPTSIGNLVNFAVNGSSIFNIGPTGSINMSGVLTSNSNVIAGVASFFQLNGRAKLSSPADSIFLMQNNAASAFNRLDFGGTTSSFPALQVSGANLQVELADGSGLTGLSASNLTSNTYSTGTNCSSSASPAVCAAAAGGSVVIAAGATSVVVDTTAVTANSQILVTEDSSLGTKLTVTCNTQSDLVVGSPTITARTGGTSFTISLPVAPTTNPVCLSYLVLN